MRKKNNWIIIVSILIFLDSSFLYIIFVIINQRRKMSQSLFSWIHLSYKTHRRRGKYEGKYCLNPYFPGFIFLILLRAYVCMHLFLTSQSLFSWIHLSYRNKSMDRDPGAGKRLNPYFPGFIFLIIL